MSSTPLATALVVPFDQLRMTDVESVGGKNASLGEMISQLAASGVAVPGGFATTAYAFRQFLKHGGLGQRIQSRLASAGHRGRARTGRSRCADPPVDRRHALARRIAGAVSAQFES